MSMIARIMPRPRGLRTIGPVVLGLSLVGIVALPAWAVDKGEVQGAANPPAVEQRFSLTSGQSRLTLDGRTGHICSLILDGKELIKGSDLPGPFRLQAPLEDYVAHTIEANRAQPRITREGETLVCRWAQLNGKRGPLAIGAEFRVRSRGDGAFELSLRIRNDSRLTIDQLFFPWIGGLGQMDDADDQVTWARSTFLPWRKWGDAGYRDWPSHMNYLGRPQETCWCGHSYFAGMKWMDFGGKNRGVTLYSEDTSARSQFMHATTPAYGSMALDMAWFTYPFLKPGGQWQSATFVLYPHRGDWHQGVLKFKEFADKAFTPVKSPPAIDETLGQFSLWISWHCQDWREVKYHFTDIPEIAREAREAGFNQMTLIRATALDFCLPHVIRRPLGTPAQLREAIERSRELGVNVIPFVTCRLIRPNTIPPAEEPEWFQTDVGGQRRPGNWSYDPTMVPKMPLRQNGDRAAYLICAGSKGWRRGFFDNLDMMCNEWDIRGFLFDQSFDLDGDLCFNPLHHHRTPDEAVQCLVDVLRESRQRLAHRFGAENVALSGEGQWDVMSQYQDLTWDWAGMPGDAFDMAFPRARTCTKCATNKTWINQVFANGHLIDLYIKDGGARMGEYPELTAYLKTLAAFKKKFVNCLARRDAYLHNMFVKCDPDIGAWARVHRRGSEALVMVTQTSGTAFSTRLTIDLAGLLGDGKTQVEVWTRDLKRLSSQTAQGTVTLELNVPKEDFVGVHLTPAG